MLYEVITAGLDAKIGLTSNFIVDLTVNPDFGQVEADPSELNLSTVETFFEEQRPFFLEGESLVITSYSIHYTKLYEAVIKADCKIVMAAASGSWVSHRNNFV